MKTTDSGLTRISQPGWHGPRKPFCPHRCKIPADQLWKSTACPLARVSAGSAWANEHMHTPGIKDDIPIWANEKEYARWTAFEFASEDDMRKAATFFKKCQLLERCPMTVQQRSLIVPKAAGRIISRLYATKKKFMAGTPLHIGKCALYASWNIDIEDRRSAEYTKTLKDMYYKTRMPWDTEEVLADSKHFVYATVFDKVKRARLKQAAMQAAASADAHVSTADAMTPS